MAEAAGAAPGVSKSAREAEPASAQTLYRGLFDLSPDAQIVHRLRPDGSLVIEACNVAGAQAVGLSTGEVEGRRIEDILPKEPAARTRADVTEAMTKRDLVRREVEEMGADGIRRLWDVVHVPIREGSTGPVTRVLSRLSWARPRKSASLCREDEQNPAVWPAAFCLGSSRALKPIARHSGDADSGEATRLLQLAESVAHVGHWRVDYPQQDVFWSEEVFRIFGVEHESYRPTVVGAIAAFHPDDRSLVQEKLERASCDGLLDFTARLARPDGELRNVLVRGFCQFKGGDDGRSLLGVIMDVTELRRAEARLRDNAALLKVTLDNMDQGLVMVDPDERVSICNQRALDLLGLPAGLMASRPRLREVLAYQARHGEFDGLPDHVKALLEPSVPGADLYSYERTRPNGTVLDIRTAPLPAGGAVRTFTDVTTHRKAEQALRATEARYRLLADYGSDLIVLGHSDGERSYISPAVMSLLGYTIEEAHTIGMREWIHPDDVGSVFSTTSALTPEDPEGSVTYRLRHKGGFYIWAEAAFRRVEGESGAFTIITAIRDATERHQRTEELRMARDAAEIARGVAESASRAKTEFLANMSHEIRTPLNSIIGFAELLATSERLEPDLRRYADLVRSSGSALLTVVNDILDFSKVEAGAIELVQTAFDPVALLDNCLSIARGAAMARPLRIDLRTDSEVPRALLGDEGRLRQILLNLLNNAVKFTPEGLVTLTLRHEGSGERGEKLRFSVIDTGIGIPTEKQDRLFQRFSQIDSTIRRDFGGTGLGLAICKRLVELMDGEIGVSSGEGEGSTFWFVVTLPQSDAQACGAAQVPAADDYRRGRLLLVDDVEVNRDLARDVLGLVGHSVDVVADGPAAIAALRSGLYDLVLMDLQMPGMDGMTATQKIRQLAVPLNGIPIIAMTANVLPDQIRQIQDAGMNDHVGKPFNRKDLYSTIERWLPRHDRGAERSSDDGVVEASGFDRTVYDDLIQLLGADNVARLARKLREELLLRFVDADDPCVALERIREDAHATGPAAGMLGFSALSAACLTLNHEDSEPVTRDFAKRLVVVQSLRNEAITILDGLGMGGAPAAPERVTAVH